MKVAAASDEMKILPDDPARTRPVEGRLDGLADELRGGQFHVLIVEEEERHLRPWDFVHYPPMTAHTFVATDDGPCVMLATGNRRDDLERFYLRSEVALRHGAGSDVTTTDPERHGRWEVRHPKDWDGLPWTDHP
jgi:hypothetical protein